MTAAAHYEMVLARPGYNEKYKREVSWDELERTFSLYKRIPMIVAGGDHYGRIDPNKAVGFVDAIIDRQAQVIAGEPTFFKKRFEREIPAEIQRRLIDKSYIPASLGYEDFDNIRKVDHIAIGVDSPVFKDVGFHAEDNFHYEETEGMNPDDRQQEKATEQAKQPDIAPRMVTFTEAQFKELLSTLRPLPLPPETVNKKDVAATGSGIPEATEVEKKKTTATTATIEAPLESEEELSDLPTPRPNIEPERVIPKQKSSTATGSGSGWMEDEHGHRFLSIPVAGHENNRETKKKER